MARSYEPFHYAKTVTTPSTAVQIRTTRTMCEGGALVIAKKVGGENTGNIFIGPSGEDQGVRETAPLAPGGSISLPACDLSDFWLDADTAGDGVTILAMN